MYFEFNRTNGEKITIDCLDDGDVIYSVGNRKTSFKLADCSNYIFSCCDGTSNEIIRGEDAVSQLHLIILHGEDQLESNNDKRETRRHKSLSAFLDRYKEMTDTATNVEEDVMYGLDADELRDAVRKLKPNERELMQRLYLDRHTVSQATMARALGINEATLWKRIERIRRKLKEKLR